MNSLRDAHVRIPRSCEYVTSHDKKDFEDVIMVMDLEMERLSQCAQSNQMSQKKGAMREEESNEMQMRIQFAVAGFENGRRVS